MERFHTSEPLGDGGLGIFPSRVGCVWMERDWQLLYLSCPGQDVAKAFWRPCRVSRAVVWVQTPAETCTKGEDAV